MNNHGLEGSVKTATAKKEDEITQNHTEDELQSKTGGEGEAGHAGVESPAQQGTSDNGDGDNDILCAAQEIDAKVKAAEREKKWLSDQIRLKKNPRLPDQFELENRRLRDELTSVTEDSEVGNTGGPVGSMLRPK